MTETRSVLVPFEGSPLSVKALEVALEDHREADVAALHVCDPISRSDCSSC